ncbi:aminotransferase class III-fold pyridoxal phosphate-dependent enzyme [Pseudorhodobacter aquimaris]|uniref:aminotransferase class III-fold pyridoxal phosphate-dependent enzyme n=1 Tax=Pseudorhodobacter aquimaris TaxID=687412 RepID=UPI00067A865B|nr:aminotransferase class III-fold pyridoxal phosphate-dependent enzyme [Pseudorhodobacter aquimaris]
MNAPNLIDLTAEVIASFCARTHASKAMAQNSRPYLADKTALSMPFSPALKEAYYPIVSDRSEGSALWDIDGNRYVDILMGLGCNLFGHNPAFVREALEQRLQAGIQIGPQSEIAGEAAERFAALTGHERVAFSNTGTEAVMTAIRLARAATGRRKIAGFTNSYHGHSDTALFKSQRLEYVRRGALARAQSGPLAMLKPLLGRMMLTGAKPGFAGIPKTQARDIIMLEYGNPRALDILRRAGKSLAAVLVEPVQSRVPDLQPREFLHGLRAVCDQTGTALIFDEMISGFRVAQGGAQEYFDIRADLATYGKIAGGGLPLSLIAGSPRFMDRIDGGQWQFGDNSTPQVPTTLFAGTYCRHPLALTAALAVAKQLQDAGPALQQGLTQKTAGLVTRLNTGLAQRGLAARFTHFGSFFTMTEGASPLLSLMALAGGLHLRPGDKGGFLSTAHDPEDLDFITTTFIDSIDRLERAGML